MKRNFLVALLTVCVLVAVILVADSRSAIAIVDDTPARSESVEAAFRASLGIDSSLAVVRLREQARAAESEGVSLVHGIPLSSDEKRDVQHRDAVQSAGGKLMSSASMDALRASISGVWLDSSAGAANAVFRIFVDGDPSVLEAESNRIWAEYGLTNSSLVISRRSPSLTTLISSAESVRRSLDGCAPESVIGVAADERTGHISVSVHSKSAEAQVVGCGVDSEFGLDIVIEPSIERVDPTVNKDQSVFGVLFGGQALTVGSKGCTSAAAVNHPVYGSFILTAGHCGSLSTSAYQGGSYAGHVAAVNFGAGATSSKFDAAAISVSSGRPVIGRAHMTSSDWAHPVNWVIGVDGDAIGNVVCQNGMTTTGVTGDLHPIERCGTLADRFYSPGGASYSWAGPYFRRTNDMMINGGDSGALTYFDAGGFGTGAFGIISGCFSNGSSCTGGGIYSHLPYVMNAWSIALVAP